MPHLLLFCCLAMSRKMPNERWQGQCMYPATGRFYPTDGDQKHQKAGELQVISWWRNNIMCRYTLIKLFAATTDQLNLTVY